MGQRFDDVDISDVRDKILVQGIIKNRHRVNNIIGPELTVQSQIRHRQSNLPPHRKRREGSISRSIDKA
jgi:hypothetical protein